MLSPVKRTENMMIHFLAETFERRIELTFRLFRSVLLPVSLPDTP